jgi:peptidoglycan hydrolase-like protein with peptidoglycan-binding domain
MARTLYGLGAHAGIVSDIQRALTAANFDPRGLDGVYGANTAAAVKAFQQAHGLSPTGTVDDLTWQVLMKKAIPGSDVRCLELTAAFEGHGYTLAQGNWDGAWLTWGIIGFTLKHGEVQKIVLAVEHSSPDLIRKAFGSNAEN